MLLVGNNTIQKDNNMGILKPDPKDLFDFYEQDDPDTVYLSEVELLGDELDEIEEIFEEEKELLVRVVVGRLRYFSGPGTTYVELGVAKRGDKFIIVEKSTGIGALNWGKIKGNQAWIPLDYCEIL